METYRLISIEWDEDEIMTEDLLIQLADEERIHSVVNTDDGIMVVAAREMWTECSDPR